MQNQDKTKFTLKHAQIFWQTYADILAEIHAPNVEVKVNVKEKVKEEPK